MALRLTPQKREFFDLFNQAALNAREISRLLVELLEGWPGNRELLLDIRAAEHEGDRLTHEVVDLLNRTFVTPFDRDDMYRLATVIDDVCDHVDEAADNIDAYEVQEVPDRARGQAEVIFRAASRLHEAVAELFRSGKDPLTIIRWKDIHEQLEEATDACENAADVLEAILVKNR